MKMHKIAIWVTPAPFFGHLTVYRKIRAPSFPQKEQYAIAFIDCAYAAYNMDQIWTKTQVFPLFSIAPKPHPGRKTGTLATAPLWPPVAAVLITSKNIQQKCQMLGSWFRLFQHVFRPQPVKLLFWIVWRCFEQLMFVQNPN